MVATIHNLLFKDSVCVFNLSVCLCVAMFVCVCVFVCMFVCVCVCECVAMFV